MTFKELLKEYLSNSTLHGARFIADEGFHITERIFWLGCIAISWIASAMLISASLDQFHNNAISFVVETSYLDWETNFPSIVICENKNMDRIQESADKLWGQDHEFTLEEVLSEISYFRGESYHTVHECGIDNPNENCITGNFSYYARYARSICSRTVDKCYWNGKKFDCCEYFYPMETEIGICYALNSKQSSQAGGKSLNMISNKFTGPGTLEIEILTEAYVS